MRYKKGLTGWALRKQRAAQKAASAKKRAARAPAKKAALKEKDRLRKKATYDSGKAKKRYAAKKAAQPSRGCKSCGLKTHKTRRSKLCLHNHYWEPMCAPKGILREETDYKQFVADRFFAELPPLKPPLAITADQWESRFGHWGRPPTPPRRRPPTPRRRRLGADSLSLTPTPVALSHDSQVNWREEATLWRATKAKVVSIHLADIPAYRKNRWRRPKFKTDLPSFTLQHGTPPRDLPPRRKHHPNDKHRKKYPANRKRRSRAHTHLIPHTIPSTFLQIRSAPVLNIRASAPRDATHQPRQPATTPSAKRLRRGGAVRHSRLLAAASASETKPTEQAAVRRQKPQSQVPEHFQYGMDGPLEISEHAQMGLYADLFERYGQSSP